jgi:hypothetical protein
VTWHYTPELRDAICEAIATTPRGLDYICKNSPDFPCAATVHKMLNEHEDFLESYLRARERQADLIFDECLEIADDSGADAYVDPKTNEVKVEGEVIQRAKLRVDTRMRMAGKLAPKKYGEAQLLKHADANGNKLPVAVVHAIPTSPNDNTPVQSSQVPS